MPTPSLSRDAHSRVQGLRGQGKSIREIAKELGLGYGTVQKYLRQPQGQKETLERDESRENMTLFSVSHRCRTVEDVLRKAEIDTSIWEVERVITNSWEVAMSLGAGESERAEVVPLWQIKVWLRRKVSKAVEGAANALLERIRKEAPKYPAVQRPKLVRSPYMLEIDLFDCHFGKLCWAAETGNNYDLKIAERIYREAVDDLLAKTAAYSLDRIVLPIGNDFFNIDNLAGTTANGTKQDVDERYPKIFLAGQMATKYAIDRLREMAPVEVVLVPGNHDKISSWHLAVVLHAVYANCQDVTVDISPMSRKVIRYGNSAIGFAHGDEEKPEALSRILLAEVLKRGWQDIKHYEWHLGHLHKSRETKFTGVDSYGNVVIRVMRALSATDAWHFGKGYVDGSRAAQGNLWSPTDGLVGQFTASVKDAA